MDSPLGGGGGGSASAQFSGPNYMQLALYIVGNALTIAIGLLLWNLNSVSVAMAGRCLTRRNRRRCFDRSPAVPPPTCCAPHTLPSPPPQVLADFRDSMLYALLCSIALRPAKDALVARLDASLADPRRSLAGALLGLVALPLTTLADAWEEGRAVLRKWRAAVQEEFQRRQAQLRRGAQDDGGAAAAATPASPCTPRTAAAAAAASAAATGLHTGAMPSLAVYGHAAVRVLKSRRTSKKRRKARQAAKRAPEGSNLLFRWLFRTCAAWLVWEWVRVSFWSVLAACMAGKPSAAASSSQRGTHSLYLAPSPHPHPIPTSTTTKRRRTRGAQQCSWLSWSSPLWWHWGSCRCCCWRPTVTSLAAVCSLPSRRPQRLRRRWELA